jgi:hypothetical protein
MSTRSKIGILRKDGSVDHVYSHWDGYPEHNGVVLIENYNNINKLNELIKNGDMSILAEHIYPVPDKAHSFDHEEGRQDDVCLFYNRDRGEDWKHTNPRTSKSLDRFIQDCKLSDCEFAYLYDEDKKEWLFSPIPYGKETDMDFCLLKDELNDKNIEHDDSFKEDYLIFDGIELMKDLDYYEYIDQYRNDSESYFEIKDMLENNLDTYMESIEEYKNEYTQDSINEYLEEIKDFYLLDYDITYEV